MSYRIPPFTPIPPGTIRDGQEAAHELKQTIETAWQQQGKRVSCHIREIHVAGRPLYEVRSNLVNGLPR